MALEYWFILGLAGLGALVHVGEWIIFEIGILCLRWQAHRRAKMHARIFGRREADSRGKK